MAKKKKTKIPRRLRKKYQKRKMSQQIIEESRKRLLEKAKADPLAGAIEIADDPPAKKMSDVIITYAAPLLAEAGSREEQKTALHMAIWFWNYTLLSASGQSEEKSIIDKWIRAGEGSPETLRLIEETLPFMVERKKELFPDNDQMITDCEIVDTPEGLGLSVAYAKRKDRK